MGIPVWHYILICPHRLADFKAQSGTNIDITDIGRFIRYRNNRGETKQMSGWGTDPPKMIQKWNAKYYGK
jgi:hypothetical protein